MRTQLNYPTQQKLQQQQLVKRQSAPIELEYHGHHYPNRNYYQQLPIDVLLKPQQQQPQPYSQK